LDLPLGLAFDSFGNLFVANTDFDNPGSIYKYTPNGNRTTFASGLGTPVGLAFNSGSLFVADAGSGTIYKFSPTGSKSIFATGLSPNSLTFDTTGNLFETDETGNIYKFDSNGNRTTFASGVDVNGVVGLVFDGDGNLFVSNGNSITKITPAGSPSTFATGLDMPNGLAFRPGIPSPILKIGHSSPNTMVISWSSASATFVLQTNSDLTTTNWNAAGFSPSTANGTNYSVAIPASGGYSFFRLQQ
jgi:sugar lactone lactonase YvrE